MQFYSDGFRPGDPRILPEQPQKKLPRDYVDVLIVGCGPAGLTLAAQLARFGDIKTKIIERKSGPMELGQADGVACRSMEMFAAFGFAEEVKQEACWITETCFWSQNPNNTAEIVRSGRIDDVEDGLSEMPHVILNQARVHDYFLRDMLRSPTRLEPDYGYVFEGMEVNHDTPFPVAARISDESTGEVKTIHARYVVGCDGARSAVRRALGYELKGDAANKAWGVMDVLAITDFPDIRMKCTLKSEAGGGLIIPREGGHLVRFYIEMDKLAAGERVRDRDIKIDDLIAAAKRILNPYKLEVKDVPWWSVYEIGQRLCDCFDNATTDHSPNIFIAGDACHTHSPKAGQGMNVSMADAFNLGWKLASVLRGQANPNLLRSYSKERQSVAQELIDFDRVWSKMVGGGGSAEDIERHFTQHGRYTAGVETTYGPSVLQDIDSHQALASGFPVGKRFHSVPVIRLADAKHLELGHCLKADGRWRILLFEGAKGSLEPAAQWLSSDPKSPLQKVTSTDHNNSNLFQSLFVLQDKHRDVDMRALPDAMFPPTGRFGLTDYERVFCADPRADIFEKRGIDRTNGCVIIVRPDQYVSMIRPLNELHHISAYFSGFLNVQH